MPKLYDSTGQFIPPSNPTTTRLPYDCNCNDDNQAKLKYYILKNPPNTTVAPVATLVTTTPQNVIVRFGKTYIIDPLIYKFLVVSLAAQDVSSFKELQDRIKQVRIANSIPAPLSIFFKDITLLGLKTSRTFLTSPTTVPQEVLFPTNPGPDYKIISALDSSDALYALCESLLITYFVNTSYQFRISNAQGISVQCDVACKYTTNLEEMFAIAKRSMQFITASANAPVLLAGATFLQFKPIMVFMVPYSNNRYLYPVKLGVLFGINAPFVDIYFAFLTESERNAIKASLQKVSELIFVPIQTDDEYIDNRDFPDGTTVNFPVTNSGLFNDPNYMKLFATFLSGAEFSNAFLG